MTQAIPVSRTPSIEDSSHDSLENFSIRIGYRIAMPEPTNHLFELTLTLTDWDRDSLDLKLPCWTPGSYLLREYAKQLQDFQARDADGLLLVSQKRAKNHWQVQTPDRVRRSTLTIRYRLFANDLTVRTNHLDRTHGFIVGAATFFRIPGLEQLPIAIELVLPASDWRVATTLPTTLPPAETTGGMHFRCPDFDTLVDTPIEVGHHQVHEFEVLGKPHNFTVWSGGQSCGQGGGQDNFGAIIADTTKIIECEAELFGGQVPYDRYMFLLHQACGKYGGLEHKDSCVLAYPPLALRDRGRDKYYRFMQLVAHEFFHLWNVKRLRPKAIEQFDYDRENYTSSLWFCEGVTSYYDVLVPLWAGVYDTKFFLKSLSKDLTGYLLTPGRQVQTLSESSWDAWVKLYRRDSNSDNSQISYYVKGMMVAMLLDLKIRLVSSNARSLDDVMRSLWERFGRHEIGYTPEELHAACEAVAGCDLSDFFATYLHSTEELPFGDYFEPFGLKLKATIDDAPHFGAKVVDESGRAMVKFVAIGSPAQRAGIDPEDELLAIDGYRITAKTLPDRLQDYRSGDTLTIALFRREELLSVAVTLADPQPTAYRLTPIASMSATQATNLQHWLRTTP